MPEWQAGERQADEEMRRGEGRVFSSDEEFIAHLESLHEELRDDARADL